MRISDWSSDVCSSDLVHVGDLLGYRPIVPQAYWEHDLLGRCESGFFGCGNGGVTRYKAPRAFEYSAGERLAIWSDLACHFAAHPARDFKREADTIDAGPCFRRQDRKSVVTGKSVSVRVDLGGRCLIQKKKKTKNNNQ